MVSIKKFLSLLFISTATALPAPDSNGQPSDLMLDNRNVLDPRAACKASDPNNQAFASHKVNGSAFCSTYIRSTVSTTFTPVVKSTSLIAKTATTTLIGITTVRTTTFLVTATTAIQTVWTTVTQTLPAVSINIVTQPVTRTVTNQATQTQTVPLTVTSVVLATQSITITVTNTGDATLEAFTTSTSTTTVSVIVTALTTVTTSIAAAAPTVSAPATEVHCNVVGSQDPNYTGQKTGQFVIGASFNTCQNFCLRKLGSVSFGIASSWCECYRAPVSQVVIKDPGASWTWYDMACNSADPPSKRTVRGAKAAPAVQAVQIPSYLPRKSASDVSSACSCLIARPSAPTTTTIAAKTPKTVITTATQTKTFAVTKLSSTFITDRKTSTSTISSKITKTSSQTVTQTLQRTVTVTNPITITVNNFNTAKVTNTNAVTVTVTNTRTVILRTAVNKPNAITHTYYFTDVEVASLTMYLTSVVTSVDTAVTTPDPVTVDGGTTTIWGA